MLNSLVSSCGCGGGQVEHEHRADRRVGVSKEQSNLTPRAQNHLGRQSQERVHAQRQHKELVWHRLRASRVHRVLDWFRAGCSLREKPRIYYVLAHLYHGDLPGLLVSRIQQHIERFRNHCGRHPQQRRAPRLKPPISGRTCEIGSFEPVSREIRWHFDVSVVGRVKLQQAVPGRQIANVNLEVNQDFQ
jgi:hypothetical protein